MDSKTIRKTMDYHPSVWGDHFLKYSDVSLEVELTTDQQKVEKLKEEVKRKLDAVTEPSKRLELIDTIQRLGLSYHFEDEIGKILRKMKEISLDDLHGLSLWFRLLRQEGYNISSDIFKKFTNTEGKFKNELKTDIRGMLSLYEAAHFMVHDEAILEEALSFATVHLKSSIASSDNLSVFLAAQVKHALEQPIRQGVPRVEARHYISIYHEDPSHSEVLLNLAKLDFNFVQKIHQKELSELTRWWKDLDVESKLPYVRDRLVEMYFWIMGVSFEPRYALSRRIMAKSLAVIVILDDTYDVHGTIEELQAFTNAVHRWNISCLDELPEYMKHVYKLLLGLGDEVDEIMENEGRGWYRSRYVIKDLWIELVQSYIVEAKWLDQNYVPTLEEYLEVALVTTCCDLLSATSFLGVADIATDEEAFQWTSKHPKFIRSMSMICRLMDDITGHKFEQKGGQAASSVECYVKQYRASEEEAYIEFRKRINEAWKDLNEEYIKPNKVVPQKLLARMVNLVCVVHNLYKYDSGFTHAKGRAKDLARAMFVDPVPV